MTGKVGRNDPCPCGSGRKYKKCCQAGFDEKDFNYRRWRRVEADLIPELLAYGLDTLVQRPLKTPGVNSMTMRLPTLTTQSRQSIRFSCLVPVQLDS